ncbi:MAG TPA: hypothetical protein VI588_01740 [Candidatus Gracilibacteria bacterium]|nr:hypothetical protein [Candidatus Gracilibacteria bacterium]
MFNPLLETIHPLLHMGRQMIGNNGVMFNRSRSNGLAYVAIHHFKRLFKSLLALFKFFRLIHALQCKF